MSVNRGLVAAAYEVHESRGKTRNSRRRIDLDPTTVAVLDGWHGWQQAERAAVGIEDDGWVFTDADGGPVHPHAISQAFERIATRAPVPPIRFHDLRGTHATLLIKAGVPVKVVSGSVTPPRRSPSTPTSTSCPACRPTLPACSSSSSPPPLPPTQPG